jgi:hypothetical protein
MREWEPDEVPATIALADVARLIPAMGEEAGATHRLLATVERMISEGDDSVVAAATTGFCEALLSLSDIGDVRFPLLAPHAGPETLKY